MILRSQGGETVIIKERGFPDRRTLGDDKGEQWPKELQSFYYERYRHSRPKKKKKTAGR